MKFLKAFFLIPLCMIFLGCTNSKEPLRIICMDTVCSVNAFNDGTEILYSEIENFLYRTENIFSPTKKTSELYKINSSQGFFVDASEELIFLLEYCLDFYTLTNGAFNVCLGSVIDLWEINTQNAQVPDKNILKEKMSLIAPEKIIIENGRIKIPEGVKLNFGAATKGWAADEIVKILKRHNVKKATIDLGGNIYVYGKKENGAKWNVGIKDPKNPNEIILKLQTEQASIVTSGSYERYFMQDGKRYHHILDGTTGWPCDNSLGSVTIISSSSLLCDVLSTAIFVLGKNKGMELLKRQEIPCEAILIFNDGTIFHSEKFE